MTADLTVGTRIYRPARIQTTGGQIIFDTPSMRDFGDGTVMLRAKPEAALAPDWQVVPWEEAGGRVCVCDEPIPADWTCLEVLFADVNFAAVSPVAGAWEDLQRRCLKASSPGPATDH